MNSRKVNFDKFEPVMLNSRHVHLDPPISPHMRALGHHSAPLAYELSYLPDHLLRITVASQPFRCPCSSVVKLPVVESLQGPGRRALPGLRVGSDLPTK